MSIKQEVLEILINNEEQYISGSFLAKMLNVSRNSVWKAIKLLEKDGYTIDAVTNKGYKLVITNDILSEVGVNKHLLNKDFFKIETYDEIDSTNTKIKSYASQNYAEGTVVAASKQTSGRGRLGRNFHSPADTGVYFSVLLRPNFEPEKSIFLTTMASIAVCQAIKEVLFVNTRIKWVNDIIFNDKKVCGILTEASFSMENFSLDYVSLGIGINIYKPKEDFPEEIKDIAGFLLKSPVNDIRNKLIAQILDNFYSYYAKFDTAKIAKEYKELSYVLGKDILVLQNNTKTKATVLDIDENCGLVVKFTDNSIKTLNSGEISTKIL